MNNTFSFILNGELRFADSNHLKTFLKLIEGYDVFISTYPQYENVAKLISKNYVITNTELGYRTMYQWFHLESVFNNFINQLSKYDNIIRIRTDVNYTDFNLQKLEIKPNIIYAKTDQIFYSESNHFIKTYYDFYQMMLNAYYGRCETEYFHLNYDNILESHNETEVKTNWLTLPEIIYDSDFNKLKNNIIKYKEQLNNFEYVKTLPMKIGMPLGYKFSSEKCFAIHTFVRSKIYKSQILCQLMNNRENFKYLVNT